MKWIKRENYTYSETKDDPDRFNYMELADEDADSLA